MFWVYMLRCADRSFYVGHTENLEKRFGQHQEGVDPSCYTFTRRQLTLVFFQEFAKREEAIAMERKIKGWNRAKKTALIAGDWNEISRIANFKYGNKSPSTGSGRTD